MHDLGDIEKQATGVQIQVASEITVSHNSIYQTSRRRNNIGDGAFGGHIIEFNDVFNTVRETEIMAHLIPGDATGLGARQEIYGQSYGI
ncbi:MAG: hypothetical protein M9904_11900 [Chitinophagaceae bacterium]|nr:hypothetical protein [Chitinophagaceae bacterium]